MIIFWILLIVFVIVALVYKNNKERKAIEYMNEISEKEFMDSLSKHLSSFGVEIIDEEDLPEDVKREVKKTKKKAVKKTAKKVTKKPVKKLKK